MISSINMNKYLALLAWVLLLSCHDTPKTTGKMDSIKKMIEELEGRTEITEDEKNRKAKSELLIEQIGLRLNKNLPYTESESGTTLRTPKEVAQRVSVLAAVNLVAFGNFSGEEITDYLKRYKLWEFTTENEKRFLKNPTEEAKNNETWKVEGIWVLLWSLKIVPDLNQPKEPVDLNDISLDNYPFRGLDKDPNEFISKMTELRTKSEILDATDLYYRIDWACVDARINNRLMDKVNSSVVYERHYALNWLVRYADEEWDDITCDT